jgi:hypothetical protein
MVGKVDGVSMTQREMSERLKNDRSCGSHGKNIPLRDVDDPICGIGDRSRLPWQIADPTDLEPELAGDVDDRTLGQSMGLLPSDSVQHFSRSAFNVWVVVVASPHCEPKRCVGSSSSFGGMRDDLRSPRPRAIESHEMLEYEVGHAGRHLEVRQIQRLVQRFRLCAFESNLQLTAT